MTHCPISDRPRFGGESGFSMIEIMVALTIVAIVVSAAMPRVRNALIASNLRSARQTMGAVTATARSAAVSRGCRATLHTQGGAVWVTACRRIGTGIDTIGPVDSVSRRFSVSMAATADSIVFTPRGFRTDLNTTVVRFSKSGFSGGDSVVINPLGKVVY